MDERRSAAVVIAIFAEPPHDVVFIERAPHLRHHPGQIGLPGGTADPADGDDPKNTGLRELYEELGVAPDRVKIVGRLPALDRISSRFIVTPLIGILEPGTLLTVDHTETVGMFTVPLASILKPDAIYDDVEISRTRGISSYALDYGEHHIWGLTGRVLKHFVDAWNAPNSQLRAAVENALMR